MTAVLTVLVGSVPASSFASGGSELVVNGGFEDWEGGQPIGWTIQVGEPMGNKPNRFGQLNYFVLPNSGLRVQYATKHFVRVEGDPPILEPDLSAELSWDDYTAGRDPALERILLDR